MEVSISRRVGPMVTTRNNLNIGSSGRKVFSEVDSKIVVLGAIHKKNVQKFQKEIDVESLADEIFSVHILPNNVRDIDCEDAQNPQLVSEYINDIYKYMWALEAKYSIRNNHLDCQSNITGRMRSILVDWLVQVHQKFCLLDETLYLTVSILDRFLQVQDIHRSKLQLIGVAATFIASKYEETVNLDVQDFAYVTHDAYTNTEILRTEGIILRKLEFNLSKPLPVHFLKRNSKAGQVNTTVHTLSKYLMEIMLPEYELTHYSPSMIAAAASYLAMRLLDSSATWNDTLAFYSHYTESEVLPLVRRLCKVLLKAESNKLQAIHSKYASPKLLRISTLAELKSDLVVKLASEVE